MGIHLDRAGKLSNSRHLLGPQVAAVSVPGDGKKAALTPALSIQNYHLECTETQAWMREKTKVS